MRALLAVLALVVSACATGAGVDPDASPETSGAVTSSTVAVTEETRLQAIEVAGRFFDAVLDRNGFAVATLGTDPPSTIQTDIDEWASSIGLVGGSFIVTKSVFTDTTAEITVRLSLDLVEVGPWSYETSVTLVGGPPWSTLWSRESLHPSLETDDMLLVDRSWLPRASILSANGTPLAGAEQVTVVGLVPSRIENLEQLKSELARLAGIDPQVVETELGRPFVQPDWFVPVGSMNQVVSDTVGQEVATLPGVVLRDGSERLAYRDDFADHLIGSVAPITADQLEALGFPYGPTDVIGQNGLESQYESQLAGSPRTAIVRINKFGRVMEELFVIEAGIPQDLPTTIDIRVQEAVERALREVTRPVAVVVLQASTSEVRAMASRPLNDGFNRAALGTYPPGSTFKVVTATALLENGFTSATEVECPAGVTLGGRTISNAGDAARGTITLSEAFAVSCNTAFAASAVGSLTPALLEQTAARLGFGATPDLGMPAAASSFPVPSDIAEMAAAAIGQDRVLASPVHMASVAGAIAAGTWRPPSVISQANRATGMSLEASAAASVQEMMLAVVTGGTGTNAAVPGVVVRGKTGSAEFGSGDLATHAWFIGYWGDLAIAVIVEGGGGGGAVAAPIAQRIIADLAG